MQCSPIMSALDNESHLRHGLWSRKRLKLPPATPRRCACYVLQVRTTVHLCRTKHRKVSANDGFNHSTTRLMNKYLSGKAQLLYPEPADVFPCDLIDSEHCRPPTSYV